jgi:hypothetical protein
MELLGSAVRRKNGFGGFGGCERRMERLWSGVCWSVRGITVERGRKRWNQPGQQNEGHRGLCAEKIKFSSGWRRLGVKEIGLGFLFPFFLFVKIAPTPLFKLWTSIYR